MPDPSPPGAAGTPGSPSPHSLEPYSLEPEPAAPRLTGEVILRPDAEDLHYALACDLLLHAFNCVRAFGDFHLALSGGSTPLPFYRRLMVDPLFRDFPWKRTHLWIVDERRVPPDDERCNFLQISETLVEHSDIPRSQVHSMDALAPNADRAYEKELRDTLSWREKGHDRLDFVLLGMGSDGHTASLFPRSPAIAEHRRLVVLNSGPTVTPPDRVTMTLPLINASRFVAVLVTGSAKRAAIERVALAAATGALQTEDMPILGVKPIGGALRWYVDHEAAPPA